MNLTAHDKDVMHAKICPYCNSQTKVITETEIYGREYKGRAVIACYNYPVCNSYVGTHDDGMPLGRLSDQSLRKKKAATHFWFDKIWKEGFIKRQDLYDELSEFLELPREYTHIGMFDMFTCIKVAEWAKKYYNSLTNHEK